jgi:hypothetical protein
VEEGRSNGVDSLPHLVLPWKIRNKYYTADVQFRVVQSRGSDTTSSEVATGGEEPAIIVLTSSQEVSPARSHLETFEGAPSVGIKLTSVSTGTVSVSQRLPRISRRQSSRIRRITTRYPPSPAQRTLFVDCFFRPSGTFEAGRACRRVTFRGTLGQYSYRSRF